MRFHREVGSISLKIVFIVRFKFYKFRSCATLVLVGWQLCSFCFISISDASAVSWQFHHSLVYSIFILAYFIDSAVRSLPCNQSYSHNTCYTACHDFPFFQLLDLLLACISYGKYVVYSGPMLGEKQGQMGVLEEN